MREPSWLFIGCCLVVWLAVWVLLAFRVKRTVARGGFLATRAAALAAFVVVAAIGRVAGVSAHAQLWPAAPGVEVLADLMVLAGTAFSIWARVALGGNWSAEVTLKEDHELIRSGPYALVRHPIYTGLLLMSLGAGVNYGRAIAIPLLAAVCAAVACKVRLEERMMTGRFHDDYGDYRARVHAIIPFIL